VSKPPCARANPEYTQADAGRYARLPEGGHDMDCTIAGLGPMGLESRFVKKA